MGEVGESETRRAALRPDPPLDEIAAQEVVANLFGCELFSLQDHSEGIIASVGCAQRSGDFERVPYAALGRHASSVDTGSQVERDLYVSQLHRRRDPMDHDGYERRAGSWGRLGARSPPRLDDDMAMVV